ncbi:hypothetical protein INR49_003835 [Caranx melampygus]|nr:hypothetical protein INR49_003835 [Caranx melampygus]
MVEYFCPYVYLHFPVNASTIIYSQGSSVRSLTEQRVGSGHRRDGSVAQMQTGTSSEELKDKLESRLQAI